jgi:hypothetical protein
MSRTYRCHVRPEALADDDGRHCTRHARGRHDPSEIVGVANCPCCRAPLVAVMGRDGPYFHCLCVIRKNCALLKE